jgi:hypothetical protein
MSRRIPDPGEQPNAEENFLQRWSRLKSTSREIDKFGAVDHGSADDGAASTSNDTPAQVTGAEAPAETPALPDLDQLDQDSDYSAFLAPQVDAALRRKALRKLFHSPKFNVCDGLDDYCDDFTRFAPLEAGVITADMRHRLERAARRLAEQLDQPPDSVSSVAESPPGSETITAAQSKQSGDTSDDDSQRSS